MAEFVKVATTDELQSGEVKAVRVGDARVCLANVDGNYFAVDDTCPHVGGSLGEGFLHEGRVTCPWHGWSFDVTSGACATVPGAKVSCFPVRVEGEDILVEAPTPPAEADA